MQHIILYTLKLWQTPLNKLRTKYFANGIHLQPQSTQTNNQTNQSIFSRIGRIIIFPFARSPTTTAANEARRCVCPAASLLLLKVRLYENNGPNWRSISFSLQPTHWRNANHSVYVRALTIRSYIVIHLDLEVVLIALDAREEFSDCDSARAPGKYTSAELKSAALSGDGEYL